MKKIETFFLILFILFNSFVFGQNKCAIDFVPNSNAIVYNQGIIDSILKASAYDAFFFGESHTEDFEPEFKYHFIQHLNSAYGVKDVFMEIGYAAAYFFNQYLRSGDTTLLVKNHLVYYGRGYKLFWKKLYNYNQALPDSLKIVIHGIDFERTEVFNLLETARNKKSVTPDYLEQAFRSFHQLPYNNRFWEDKKAQDILSSIRTEFAKHPADFKELYDNNFQVVENALNNKAPITTTVNERNKIWFRNMEAIILEKKIKKFVCFFGSAHVTYDNKTSLTNTIKNTTFFNGSILNIATMYTHILNSNGRKPHIVEYGFKEKEVVDAYYDRQCRATIIPSSILPKTGFKTASDFIIFAKENVGIQ